MQAYLPLTAEGTQLWRRMMLMLDLDYEVRQTETHTCGEKSNKETEDEARKTGANRKP